MNKKDYCYYSRLLNKPFDTVAELNAAEEEYRAIEQRKAEAAAEKKSDAKKVEEAFQKLNAVKRQCNVDIDAAIKECAKVIANARLECNKKVTASREVVAQAENEYAAAIKEFTAKHPEGYHVTLRDGDNVTTIAHTAHDKLVSDVYSTILKLFE